jgi:hypothetical protein
MLEDVYVLEHIYERIAGHPQNKLIGVYTSETLAKDALDRSRLLEGFRDWPDHFFIRTIRVDDDLFVPRPGDAN